MPWTRALDPERRRVSRLEAAATGGANGVRFCGIYVLVTSPLSSSLALSRGFFGVGVGVGVGG